VVAHEEGGPREGKLFETLDVALPAQKGREDPEDQMAETVG
jgi:hypothetical protein